MYFIVVSFLILISESNPLNPMSNGGESVKEEVSHESSGRPPFAIPQSMREEQVQNAVNFLSHPKVKGSPVIFRCAFLEKKGLSKEEIDEAFRRVPVSLISSDSVLVLGGIILHGFYKFLLLDLVL